MRERNNPVGESYKGTKFETIFESRSVPRDSETRELKKWCRIFAKAGLAPAFRNGIKISSAGNLSARFFRRAKKCAFFPKGKIARLGGGFVITAAGCNLARMPEGGFVKVIRCNAGKGMAVVQGAREPSSETMLHDMIYKIRPGANFIFHGHDEAVVKKARALGLVETGREKPYGSRELVLEAERAMEKNPDANFIVLKNHGFVSIGAGAKEAGERAVEMRSKARAREISKSHH